MPKQADVRVLCATNRNIHELLATRVVIREDFFYRLHVLEIHLPPLRDRLEDLPLLIEEFSAPEDSRAARHPLPPELMPQLIAHAWPGNVRELRNVLRRYQATGVLSFAGQPTIVTASGRVVCAPAAQTLRDALTACECDLIAAALANYHGSRTKTAAALGISVRDLRRKIAKHTLLPPYQRKIPGA